MLYYLYTLPNGRRFWEENLAVISNQSTDIVEAASLAQIWESLSVRGTTFSWWYLWYLGCYYWKEENCVVSDYIIPLQEISESGRVPAIV